LGVVDGRDFDFLSQVMAAVYAEFTGSERFGSAFWTMKFNRTAAFRTELRFIGILKLALRALHAGLLCTEPFYTLENRDGICQ
jgi:hypothetical protein